MSLRVWLPLNGDLKNKGLDGNISLYNNTGAIINENGKIGKCYYFDGVDDWISFNINKAQYGGHPLSFAAWVKCGTARNKGQIIDLAADLVLGYSYNSTWNTINFRYWRSYKNSSGLRTGDSSETTLTYSPNKWYHIVGVFENNLNKIYVDGKLSQVFDSSSKYTENWEPLLSQIYRKLSIGKSAGDSNWGNMYVNDVRIYDHALSLKQIQQIAKGLILHYKLDDKYIEPTANLITTEDCLSNTCYNGAISKYSYGANTNMYKTVGIFQGKKCTKVYNQENGIAMCPYVYISNMFTSNGTNAPEYKTLSFDYYTTISTKIGVYKLGNGTGTATYIVKNSTIEKGTGVNSVLMPVEKNVWNHIEITLHGETDSNAEWGYIQNFPVHTSDISNYWLFANMQLETKDHATGYAGVGGIRSNPIVYDSSGYQNDGTIIGNIQSISDSPKYAAAASFDGASAIKVVDNNWVSQGMRQMTINLWIKPTTSSFPKIFSCTESGGWNTQSGKSGYIRFPIYVYTDQAQTSMAYKYDSMQLKISDIPVNEWSMITLIYDETGTRTYINGKLHHTYSNISYGIHYNLNARLFLGCEAGGASPAAPYFVGQQNDFRIYATALSAEDIKELYQTSALIDRNQNLYVRELVEI